MATGLFRGCRTMMAAAAKSGGGAAAAAAPKGGLGKPITESAQLGNRTIMPLDYHYEDVLRQDLLLKLNYDNVMQVPGLREIRVVPKAPFDFTVKSGKLAMDISCGQKFKDTQKGPPGKSGKSFRSNPFVGSFKDKGNAIDVARQSTLRGLGMSNFLVRILTVMSVLDSRVEVRENTIQLSMDTEFCQFSPELEDHFEIFEHIRGFNVNIVTSANTQDENSLLWSGFLQKDDLAIEASRS